jgi:lysophospholipase L1-like esterase
MKRSFTFVFLTILLVTSAFSQISSKQKINNPAAEKAAKLPEAVASDTPDRVVFYQAAIRADEKVVFFGDSITENWHLNEYFPQMSLYINRGVAGDTTPWMLNRFQTDVIDLNPRVVVILGGTNDIAGLTGPVTSEQTRDNLAEMTRRAQENGIRVVLASIIPVNNYCLDSKGNPYVQTAIRPPAQILARNELIRTYAEQNRIIYLDYHTAMVDADGFMRAGLTNDGLHPNANGYAVMTPLVLSAIRSALKRKRS